MKKIALLLSAGYEEGEAINVVDILRRLQISVTILSCDEALSLKSYHNVEIQTNALFSTHKDQRFDAVVLVGGPPNTDKLGADEEVIDFIRKHIDNGAYIAALCSSGAKVLAKNKLLGTRKYVWCGEFYRNFDDGCYVRQPVVVDGQFITGQDYGYTIDFAFALADMLIGDQRTRSPDVSDINWVAKHINYCRYSDYLTPIDEASVQL